MCTGTEINVGQNLEDAIITERFFRGGPLKDIKGFFVEMGALDGIVYSNTLVFEHCLGWDGLLIEAQPENAAACIQNRKCVTVHSGGVCPAGQHTMNMSTVANGVAHTLKTGGIQVPCEPLSQIFKTHSIHRIHFFSLDVEGAELDVLQTIQWDAVQIDVLMVETDMAFNANQTKIRAVRKYLASVGMIQVPSKFHNTTRRNGRNIRPMFLSISGSDLFLGNQQLLEYDRTT
jgi:FkbM family methyltransferase